jgi:cellulose synthase (UDP-forming)
LAVLGLTLTLELSPLLQTGQTLILGPALLPLAVSLFTLPPNPSPFLLFWPTVVFVLLTQVIIYLSPRPNRWSRAIIIALVSAFLLRYLVWRLGFSLNFDNFLNAGFSLVLLGAEGVGLASTIIQFILLPHSHDRQREADVYSQAVISGQYQPTVDVLIPTHNEPVFILKRTIIACQALDYAPKTIHVLDDGGRPEIEHLCQELGCHYLGYPENRQAKGGNLNFGLCHSQGELIAVFDADFVPTRNFLTRTVGFFQQDNLALVQTPQSFYNADPIATNLGLAQQLTSEEESFYRQIQPMKDGARSVLCAGTSFVMRRQALERIGGFDTDSLSEDYFTGIRLSAQGYDLAYLDEKLSAGLAAESISTHLMQRLRWGQGTLQAFFIKANPLTIPGLTWRQRLAHLEGLLNWFGVLPRLCFLLIPCLYAFVGILPLRVTTTEVLYFFLPYYCLQFSTFHWLNYRSRSIFFSELYAIVSFFPIAITVVQTLLNPFGKKFNVTPKGLLRKRYRFDYQLAFPVLIFLVMTGLSLYWMVTHTDLKRPINLTLIWGSLNLLFLTAALNAFLDVPKVDFHTWLTVQKPVTLLFPQGLVPGKVVKISEKGAELRLKTQNLPQTTFELVFTETALQLQAKALAQSPERDGSHLSLEFVNLNLNQERQLIEFLFCQPGTWPYRQSPGELGSLGLILKSLLRPWQILRQNRLLSRGQLPQLGQ